MVWSRIDAETMTARNLPFFKTKLRDVSRSLYLEHGWKMPRGLMNAAARNPTNVTLAEWQRAKRRGRNAIDQKMVIQGLLGRLRQPGRLHTGSGRARLHSRQR